MDLDATQLIVALMVSLVGMSLFYYGKKQRRAPHLAVGLVFMVFPYFVSNLVLVLLVVAALSGGLWLAVSRGL